MGRGKAGLWLWVSCFMVWSAWAGDEPVTVVVGSLDKLLLYPERDIPAEVIGLQRSRISAQVSGVLAEITVEVGERVAQNAVLSRQDCWELRGEEARAAAAVNLLQAELSLARRQKERATILKQKGQESAEILDQRVSALATGEARLHSQEIAWRVAKEWLEKCDTRAPFAGIIVGRQARLGEWVVTGTPLFDLIDDQAVELTAHLDPMAESSLIKGGVFEPVVGSYPVVLRVLLPVRDPTTRTYEGRFVFTGPRPWVGTAGRLRWQDSRPHVPAWLLVRRQEVLGVFVVQEGVAQFKKLPEAQEGRPALWSGTSKNVVVVLEGREGLQEGQQVVGHVK